MSNYVLEHRHELAPSNYIIKAQTIDYWFGFAYHKMQQYIADYGDRFSIVVAGFDNFDDFYAIPFRLVKHVFTKEHLCEGEGGTRWMGSIRDGMLHVRNYPDPIDIRRFYGNIGVLSNAPIPA